jgi:hypothetical protein
MTYIANTYCFLDLRGECSLALLDYYTLGSLLVSFMSWLSTSIGIGQHLEFIVGFSYLFCKSA